MEFDKGIYFENFTQTKVIKVLILSLLKYFSITQNFMKIIYV